MRNTVINTIHEAARKNKNIIFLTADLGFSVIEDFQNELPEQVFNVGISEQNMVGVAAGLALQGKKVFIYSIMPFVTMRCLEQIRVDICYQNLDVTVVGVGAGFAYGTLGATHHSIEDIAVMRVLPNMKIISPADPLEAEKLIEYIIKNKGPFFIRLNRGGEENLSSKNKEISFGKGRILREGKEVSILSTGSITEIALEAAQLLKNDKIDVEVISFHTLKPLDVDLIENLISNRKIIITLEEHSYIGGLGSAVSEVIAESDKKCSFKRIGINDEYPKLIGRQDYLRGVSGLSTSNVVGIIKEIYEKEN
ncbi:MAG: 1-deoxy-D-xylulose-5-phosphate synthase [Candidatus Magasanikbacteria bacterium]|jgi:transketolase|nr:1-deoxy-D-xylulose-5-phosphate synthase [Candidatus Magasanikbacteria bacterium]MBT4314818.1 1-deoxy-D-xylulose-5-phosphate synthase [Candidatus Magasanikbacteria bacterium]MBT4547595.1 1-deoxy-D-xylulose-5-phosphate synthase [Candidatus Magasanikbacteria bacterium]MBT6818844.1 1-deoxy-D-xylulose-5-phosphate synthase [Candidatus Magasanikbacteria bacterium]